MPATNMTRRDKACDSEMSDWRVRMAKNGDHEAIDLVVPDENFAGLSSNEGLKSLFHGGHGMGAAADKVLGLIAARIGAFKLWTPFGETRSTANGDYRFRMGADEANRPEVPKCPQGTIDTRVVGDGTTIVGECKSGRDRPTLRQSLLNLDIYRAMSADRTAHRWFYMSVKFEGGRVAPRVDCILFKPHFDSEGLCCMEETNHSVAAAFVFLLKTQSEADRDAVLAAVGGEGSNMTGVAARAGMDLEKVRHILKQLRAAGEVVRADGVWRILRRA